MSFRELLLEAATEYGIRLEEDQLSAFELYKELLLDWNQRINLTAITEPKDVAVKHMIDSLSCYDSRVFTSGCSVVDVGTGAGFPGLPLKIYRPDIRLTLMDSLNKRLLFLNEVVVRLGLEASFTVHARAEDAGRQKSHREAYHVAVSRAVARLNVLCELCIPMVEVGGWFVALKGAQYQDELSEATHAVRVLGGKVEEVRPISLPGLDDVRAVIYIRKEKATSSVYPRKPGLPEKKPL